MSKKVLLLFARINVLTSNYLPNSNKKNKNLKVCINCIKTFKDNNRLKKHLVRVHQYPSSHHTMSAAFKCDQCGKSYKNLKTLKNHERHVHKELQYKCKIYLASFLSLTLIQQQHPIESQEKTSVREMHQGL